MFNTATCSSHLLSDRFIEANLILLKPEPAHTIPITSVLTDHFMDSELLTSVIGYAGSLISF